MTLKVLINLETNLFKQWVQIVILNVTIAMSNFESLHNRALGTEQWLSWEEDLGRLQGTNVYFLPTDSSSLSFVTSVLWDLISSSDRSQVPGTHTVHMYTDKTHTHTHSHRNKPTLQTETNIKVELVSGCRVCCTGQVTQVTSFNGQEYCRKRMERK